MKKILKGILITVAGLLAGLVATVVVAMILTSVWDGLEDGPDGWFSQVVGLVLISLALGGGVYWAWKIEKRGKGKAIQRTDQSSPPGNYLPSDSSTTSETSTRNPSGTQSRPSESTTNWCLTMSLPSWSPISEWSPTKKLLNGSLVVLLIVVVIIVVANTSSGTENPKPPNIPATREAAEERQKGFHCLSAWDGNHDGLEDLIKAKLKDPDSMETIETKMTPVDANGNHNIILKYRARNSFGGMVVEQALGIVNNDTCEATLLGVE